LRFAAVSPLELKGSGQAEYQAAIQQQVEKKLMFGVVIGIAECSDKEGGEAARRQARS
jgi:hypothetical protein